jgi:outer membrane protein
MRLFYAITLFFLLHTYGSSAQQSDAWSLERCIQYAVDHNISIKQDSLNARLARYTLLQSQLSQLPTFTANSNYGRSFGRSINPTTNQFVDAGYNFLSASGNGNLLVFGWKQVRNTIARNRLSMAASLADLDQLKDDVSLNVATGFLTAVLAREQINISKSQVALSKAQLDQTRAFAEAGRLPELSVAQLEAQLATDSATLINAISNYTASLLDLKALLNLDFSVPFDLEVPEVIDKEDLEVAAQTPEEVFQVARSHFGAIQASELRVRSAEKNVAAAKGALYPQLTAGYQVGTNFASNYQTVASYSQNGYKPVGFTDTLTFTPVYQPNVTPVFSDVPFTNQLANNMRQSVYVGVNIPILNGWQSQYAVRQARINLATQQLNEYSAELTLKQNVYKAHNNAVNAIQKYSAARRADESAKRALDFARKRYDLGLTSTVDLLVTQNNEFTAASNRAIAKYDLIFKLKVIDYYLGKQLKL